MGSFSRNWGKNLLVGDFSAGVWRTQEDSKRVCVHLSSIHSFEVRE